MLYGWQVVIALICIFVPTPLAACLITFYKPKKIYKVQYLRIGLYRVQVTTYVKARSIMDIQRQLDKKEAPYDVEILSVEVVI